MIFLQCAKLSPTRKPVFQIWATLSITYNCRLTKCRQSKSKALFSTIKATTKSEKPSEATQPWSCTQGPLSMQTAHIDTNWDSQAWSINSIHHLKEIKLRLHSHLTLQDLKGSSRSQTMRPIWMSKIRCTCIRDSKSLWRSSDPGLTLKKAQILSQ